MWWIIDFDSDHPGMLVLKIFLWLTFMGVSWLGYQFYPDILGMKREAVVNSHQYIEASRSKLSKLATEYRSASVDIATYKSAEGDFEELIGQLTAQKIAIKDQIKTEVTKIPENEIPSEVVRILEEEE